MASMSRAKLRAGIGGALVAVGLVVAGCGSSSSSSSSSAATSAVPAANTSVAGVSVGSTKGAHGVYLTGPSGRALYLWVADTHGTSSCSGACAQAWPPLLTKGAPTAAAGVKSSNLGTITRSDGSKQVTYMGHPLYYFAGDPSSGTVHGEGSDSFGAKWWLVAPSGTAITVASKSTSGAASSSSSSGSGGSGWG